MINYSENENRPQRTNNSGSAWILGIILIAAGCLFIFTNTGLIPWAWKHLLFSWQMLLIVIGIISFSRGNNTAGTVLVLIGGFFILPKLHLIWPGITFFGPGFTRNFWPIIIILAGLAIIIFSRQHRGDYYRSHNQGNNANPSNDSNLGQRSPNGGTYRKAASSDGYVNFTYVFSGGDEVFLDPVFKGGNIKASFGGGSLDLRRTSLPEGEPAYLKIDAFCGGVTIMVPDDWNVEIRKNAFLGGFDDQRRFRPSNPDPNKKLILDISCLFGGGELK